MLFIYNILINLVTMATRIVRGSAIESERLWQGRFGEVEHFKRCDIWLHAASVGEVKVIGHLIDYLLREKPELKIHVTTMTKAGFSTAELLYGERDISLSFFHFDKRSIVKKTFEMLTPKLLIIAETEIWPNTILEASERNIPIILINGRMSEKAFGKYKIFRNSFSKLLSKYDKLFLKSDTDFNRYAYFNLDNEKMAITGDLKFDAPITDRDDEIVKAIKKSCGIQPDSFLMVAGSTRPGEEEILLNLFEKMYADHKTFNLVIAPRHLDRIGEIKELFHNRKIPFKLFGSETQLESLILVDKFGLLQKLYIAADISFVGGTFVDIGGHNLLEPVWAGSPVLFGESVYNVVESAEYIQENNYGAIVHSEEELYSLVLSVFKNEWSFAKKTSSDIENSATSLIGKYVIHRLNDD